MRPRRGQGLRDLRRREAPRVVAEKIGRGHWTLTGDRTGAKNVVSQKRDRSENQGRKVTDAGLGGSGKRPPDGRRIASQRRATTEVKRDRGILMSATRR